MSVQALTGGIENAMTVALSAPHTEYQSCVSRAILYDAPFPTANRETEVLFGWPVRVIEDLQNGWLKVENGRDGYPGYMREESLSKDLFMPTHRVSVLHTIVLDGAKFRSNRAMDLWHNSMVQVEWEISGFSCVKGAGFVPSGHLVPIHQYENDPVAVARRYLGAPYYWAGLTDDGLDCSGYVQQVYCPCGAHLPRDARQQLGYLLGQTVTEPQPADLAFFEGHVVICTGNGMAIHANGDTGNVVEEPLADIIKRRGKPIAICRPSWPGRD